MKQCIATILVGDASRQMWRDIFEPSWRAYEARHGVPIEVFTDPVEYDPGRSPSWQKLLLAGHKRLQKYDQILYLDHDVMLSPHAPLLDCPHDKIGAVTWQGSYSNDPVMLKAFQQSWAGNVFEVFRKAKSFGDLMQIAGFEPIDDHLNAGVLAFSPQHADFLRGVYENHTQDEGTSLEQAAMTYSLCGPYKHLCHPLDRRWNVVKYLHFLAYYPFVDDLYPASSIIERCIDATLANCYALHFAAEGERLHAKFYVQQKHLRDRRAA